LHFIRRAELNSFPEKGGPEVSLGGGNLKLMQINLPAAAEKGTPRALRAHTHAHARDARSHKWQERLINIRRAAYFSHKVLTRVTLLSIIVNRRRDHLGGLIRSPAGGILNCQPFAMEGRSRERKPAGRLALLPPPPPAAPVAAT
jgi:hypothetical protein